MGQTKHEPVIGYAHDRAPEGDGAVGQREPWRRLLADAAPRDHIVQLYQDQYFLNRAVCRFAAAALANGEVHARMLPRLGENHSHLIPVEDYARLERAVADALRETVGSDEARVLEGRLLADYPTQFHMPRPQALLLALRQVLPLVADAVLQRSRTLYTASEESDR
ncbi:MAG: hypothetical protein M3436_07695 [Pseudomonadota bacterium]|nr:hypothetical protein [Pseudomonadota bacterium]